MDSTHVSHSSRLLKSSSNKISPNWLGREADVGPSEPHQALQISQYERDPVQIIQAAQIQLRRWRWALPPTAPAGKAEAKAELVGGQRVREIVTAREMMLRRAMERLANRHHQSGGSFAESETFLLSTEVSSEDCLSQTV